MGRMRIAQIASEMTPLAKTGGLADVVGTLARQLEAGSHKVTVFLPYYREVRLALKATPQQVRKSMPIHLAPGITQEVNVYQAQLPGSKVNVMLIDNARSFDRDHLYGTGENDYPDNADRFILFCRAVLNYMKDAGEVYDIIHCHDWQTALIPAYIRKLYAGDAILSNPGTVFTIHNLAYQGVFPKETMVRTGLGWDMFIPTQMEFYGKVNFMKAGIIHSEKLTTVSPTYAKEIMTKELGSGLEGLLKTREGDISGILNGIDDVEWDPSKDTHIAAQFTRKNASGKAECRKALLQEAGFDSDDSGSKLVIGTVSRLAGQKGFDILAAAIPKLAKKQVRLVILGSGEQAVQSKLEDACRSHPKAAVIRAKFDNAFAHRIYAGADAFLMPSRFEPCGLGQMISMRYGTLPIAHATGGLVDTVKPFDRKAKSGNGFLFREPTPESLVKAVDEAIEAHGNAESWKALMNNAMGENFSWASSVKHYESVYAHAITAWEKKRKRG